VSTKNPPDSGDADTPLAYWESEGTADSGARIAVLAVHGRGQDPSFMKEQSLRFDVPGVRFYAPEAPDNTWYPLGFTAPLEDNEPKLSESLGIVDDHLHRVLGDGFTLGQIVLWGFSQGACLLTQYAIHTPQPFGGLLLYTGGYLGPEALAHPSGLGFAGVPVVIRSIDEDPWVPKERVEETAEYFVAAGARVDSRIDKGTEHGITDEAVKAGKALLESL